MRRRNPAKATSQGMCLTKNKSQDYPLKTHLHALQHCVLRAGASVLLFFIALVYWAQDFFHLLVRPLFRALPQHSHLVSSDVMSSFVVPMKITLLLAFVLALPYMLYQAWLFISPGLYPREKRWVLPLLLASYLLFLLGISFVYFVVFPNVFVFIVKYSSTLGVKMFTDIERYLDFAITSFWVFGLSFEVPVLVLILVVTKTVTPAKLDTMRPYVIVGSFIIAAVLTPPDVLSQLLLALPLCLLFELGLLLSRCFIARTP
jgi:sec-independent protein translocase protein TatC